MRLFIFVFQNLDRIFLIRHPEDPRRCRLPQEKCHKFYFVQIEMNKLISIFKICYFQYNHTAKIPSIHFISSSNIALGLTN
jgi:hypothetical protein